MALVKTLSEHMGPVRCLMNVAEEAGSIFARKSSSIVLSAGPEGLLYVWKSPKVPLRQQPNWLGLFFARRSRRRLFSRRGQQSTPTHH
jgi:hypothetical protein